MLDEAIDEARAEYARLKPQYEAFAASVAALVSQLTETAGLTSRASVAGQRISTASSQSFAIQATPAWTISRTRLEYA
jgi:hypothetical protein